MVISKTDKVNRFVSRFDTESGIYYRSGVIENGIDTGKDPFMASFPELIDIGIMGHCTHGLSGRCEKSGVQCYQHGDIIRKPNMSLDNFKKIIDQCIGKTFQVALGGRGDPDQHKDFDKIIKYSRENNIVPNYTTSGFGLTPELADISKQYCGAVAVSWYGAEYTNKALELLISARVTTNIHFVLGSNTIDEAIEILESKGKEIPDQVNAIIFLLHKPVGLGRWDNILETYDDRVKKFFKLVDYNKYKFKIGFDSCSIPGILNYTRNISKDSIDTCEAARWSMYITSDMYALPCSFDNQLMKYAVQLDPLDTNCIQKAWYSEKFADIRNKFRHACPNCEQRERCLGGCPLIDGIQLCEKRH